MSIFSHLFVTQVSSYLSFRGPRLFPENELNQAKYVQILKEAQGSGFWNSLDQLWF